MNANLPRRLAAAVMILALPALGSCSSVNFNAQTDQIYTPADGVNARDGQVDVLNALVVSGAPGSGRFLAGLVNNDNETEDEIVAVRGAGDDADLEFTLEDGETTIPAGALLDLSDDEVAPIVISGDETKLTAGLFIEVTLVFANAEQVTVEVPVYAPGEDYADIELPVEPDTDAESVQDAPEEPVEEEESHSDTEEE